MKKNKKKFNKAIKSYKSLLLVCLLISGYGIAQTEINTIHSEILEADRKFIVRLPSSYNKNENYPLVVMTDASFYFNLVKEAANNLYQGGFPKMIVVGIFSDDRYKDLTPTKTDESSTSGGSDKFLKFLKSELIPEISSKYSVSNFHVLIGHSLGGLFTLTTSIKEPELFDAYIASTPTVRWNNFEMLDNIQKKYFNELNNKKLFLSIGDEKGIEREGVLRFNTKFSDNVKENGNYVFKSYPDESHSTVPWMSYYEGLKHIFAPFNLKTSSVMSIKELVNYYQKLGHDYDYDVKVPQRILMNNGSYALEDGKFKKALNFFKYYAENYSNIPIPFRFLGDTYFKMKDYKKAKKHYESAYKLFQSGYVKSRLLEISQMQD